jgi:hypothetical protein
MRRLTFLLFGMVALGQMVGAQSSPPRPNVAITAYPSLFYTPVPADFDNDGRADVVAGRRNGSSADLVYRHGNGDGTFAAEQVIATGVAPIAAGDFNGDGNLDVLVPGYSILPGHGDGTFGAPVATGAADAGGRILVADFDGNGTADFAASTTDEGDTVQFFAGHGDFSFTASPVYTTDPYTEQMAVGDFNGDGRLDLAIAAIDLGRVNLLINQGAMSFTQSYVPLDRSPLGVAVFDIDGDSVEDLIVSATDVDYFAFTFTNGFIYVMHGNGDGTFTEAGRYQTARGPRVIVLGDFNRDGVLDVASGNYALGYDGRCDGYDGVADNETINPGLSGGGFGTAVTFTIPQPPPPPPGNPVQPPAPISTSLTAVELNGDGHFDLFGAGAVLLNVPAAANHAPVVSAGPDRPGEYGMDFYLDAVATDADNDWLTYEWRDDDGELLGTTRHICGTGKQYYGAHTFTVTVRDDRGGVGTDSVTMTFPEQPLPSGWSGNDVGAVSAQGSDTFDGTTYTVRGSGADVCGTADEFLFAYQLLTGDFEISGRVATVQNVNAWTKAGFMVRESLSAGSRHAFVIATPSTTKGIAFQRRTTTNGTSVNTDGPKWAPAVYLRLVRRGDTISAFARQTATDNWIPVGTQTYSALPSSLYVGMAVSSHVDGTVATATFDDVQTSTVSESPQLAVLRPLGGESVQANAPYVIRWQPVNTATQFTRFDVYYSTTGETGPWTAISECSNVDPAMRYCVWHRPGPVGAAWVLVVGTTTTGSAEATSYDFSIQTVAHGSGNLPAGWWCGDVPGFTTPEPINVSCGYEAEDELSPNFVVTAAGSDIWGTDDHFGWAGTPVYGEFTITARVVNVQNVNQWTKAGLMIRVLGTEEPTSENGDAPHASFFVTPTTVKGTAFQRRTSSGGASVSSPGPSTTAPIWMRMHRHGNTIDAWYRKNATDSWTFVGSQTFGNGLPYQLYAMFAVSSHVAGTTATARFDNVVIDDARPMAERDIGDILPEGSGTVGFNGMDTIVAGAGADIWGTADAFHYYYTKWNGDGRVILRVKSIENKNAWSKAGIMFRETLDPGSKQVMAIVSPSKGIAMQYRSATNGSSAQAAQIAGHAPVWLMLRRFGNHFEASYSTDGESWNTLGAVDVTMGADVYVGLPVTSHVDHSTIATAHFDDVHFIP